MARHTFIVNDETVINSYGFRVLTKGIRYDDYNSNPLVLWMHKRPSRWSSNNDSEKEIFPIGLAYNIRVKGPQLLADIELDENDEFAQKIEQKIESKHIRMASAGMDPISWSDDKKVLLPGQKYATLTESELLEISICDIGANKMALKLYNSNLEAIELTAGNKNDFIPLANTQIKNKTMDFTQRIALMLGLDAEASEDSIAKNMKQRLELASNAEEWKGKYETLSQEMSQAHEANVVALVDSNIDKKFTADKKDFYVQLGKDAGMDVLKNVIDQLPEMKKPSGTLQFTKNPASKGEVNEDFGEVKTFSDLKEKGKEAVELCRKNDPETYKRLFKAEYGCEPDLED